MSIDALLFALLGPIVGWFAARKLRGLGCGPRVAALFGTVGYLTVGWKSYGWGFVGGIALTWLPLGAVVALVAVLIHRRADPGIGHISLDDPEIEMEDGPPRP